jgi:predicted nucleic acid-binding protein
MSKKKSVYIETTIPSYITAKDSRDVLKLFRQTIARKFWDDVRIKYDLYVSELVIIECSRGDPIAAKKRVELLNGIPLLPINDKILQLAPIYKTILSLPEKAKVDAFHLAVAVVHEINYILSWNFAHMGIESYGILLKYNDTIGIKTPLLVTPEILLDTGESHDLL